MTSTPYAQMHPKVSRELGTAIEAFAKANDLTLNRASMHLLTLGLKTMNHVYGGSMLCYLNNTTVHVPEHISPLPEEIH